MGKRIINIGDVFEIPLADGRKAFGQYGDQNVGEIVRIFDYFIPQNEDINLSALDTSNLLFCPIKFLTLSFI